MDNVDQQANIYLHWVAIAIYDYYINKSKVNNNLVNTVAARIQKFLSTDFIKNDQILMDCESTYTALLCQEF